MQPDIPDFASRRPVWLALAELYLDTDVTLYYDHIAEVLAASPYSLAELRAILYDEVHPALAANLLGVAGEWAAWDEAWLIQRIASRPRDFLAPLVSLRQDWDEVARRINARRGSS